jgi:60 kDa SS-A/Ro ribonucleoprotein
VVPAIDAFLTAQAVSTEAEAIHVVTERGVPWEYLPSQVLSAPKVWEALAPGIGMTALIRNLARMTRIGTIAPYAAVNAAVVRRLTDAEALRAARIHPMDAWLALRVYNSCRSQPNPKAAVERWSPVGEISDALEEAYNLSFGHTEPSGRRMLVAVDSSGSMTWGQVAAGGSLLGTAYQVGCGMAAMIKRIEGGNVHVIDADTAVRNSRVTVRTNLREIASWQPSGGGTDLSLPFAYAAQHQLNVDGFLVLTDGETWAGKRHAFQALNGYRRRYNPAARVVVASMTAVGHTIGEPGDPGVLNVAGMDASLPKVVTGLSASAIGCGS